MRVHAVMSVPILPKMVRISINFKCYIFFARISVSIPEQKRCQETGDGTVCHPLTGLTDLTDGKIPLICLDGRQATTW